MHQEPSPCRVERDGGQRRPPAAQGAARRGVAAHLGAVVTVGGEQSCEVVGAVRARVAEHACREQAVPVVRLRLAPPAQFTGGESGVEDVVITTVMTVEAETGAPVRMPTASSNDPAVPRT